MAIIHDYAAIAAGVKRLRREHGGSGAEVTHEDWSLEGIRVAVSGGRVRVIPRRDTIQIRPPITREQSSGRER